MNRLLVFLFFLFLSLVAILLFSNDAFTFVFSKKVWAHKVNTIQKKKEASQKFSGVELDLVYDQVNGSFDVNHPPDSSINLSLEAYLKADKNLESGYWFDLKNLTAENAESAGRRMDSITRHIGLDKRKVIVESQNYQHLKIFAAKGFTVSYYLPSLYQMAKDSLATTINEIEAALVQFPTMYISSNYRDYWIMKQYFPEKNKLLWWKGNRDAFWGWKNRKNLYRIMSDKTVKVLLVPFQSKLGDR